jgi:hypothetical protein
MLPGPWHSWIPRIEFLEDHVDSKRGSGGEGLWSALPSYVRQHDGDLEDQVRNVCSDCVLIWILGTKWDCSTLSLMCGSMMVTLRIRCGMYALNGIKLNAADKVGL